MHLINAQGLNINFTSSGTSPAMDTAIEYAGDIWSDYLSSSVTINVHVHYVFMMVPGLKMVTIGNVRRDFSSAAFDSTWYPTSLANKLEGVTLNPGEADMDIFISDAVPWYLGTDLNCGETEYDFVTHFLRELAHGFGIMSITKVSNDTIGSIGTLTGIELNEFQPTSYTYPHLAKKYSVFDQFLQDATGNLITDTVLFPNPSVALFDFFTSDDVFFNGTHAFTENGNINVPIYSPGIFSFGNTLQSFNESSYPSGTYNALLTPDILLAEVIHTPGNVVLAVLEDLGWTLIDHTGIPDGENEKYFYPNPASQVIFLPNNVGDVEIINLQGVVVKRTSTQTLLNGMMDVSDLEKGMYFVKTSLQCSTLIKTD